MYTTHNGKIGRLPLALREQINRRLADGETARSLVVWLNGLPEVKDIMTAHFRGQPVREQNLSQWRIRGFRLWCADQAVRSATAAGLPPGSPSGAALDEAMAVWAAQHYLQAANQLVNQRRRPRPTFRLVRRMCQDLLALRRAGHLAARRKLHQERAEWRQPPGRAGKNDLSVS